MTLLKEAYSRVVIDRKLREAGWDIENPNQVSFEVHGDAGRADYVLKDDRGKPIALIEAKSPEIDPYAAKQQAKNYAVAQFKGQIDFIFLANDHLIYFWDQNYGDAQVVSEFYSQDDLIRRKTLRSANNILPLTQTTVTDDYFKNIDSEVSLRPYQIEAWNKIAQNFEKGKRGFLLEMATGTGKTLLSSLIISRFLKTNQAQSILFIVDRISLATQTKGVFEKFLAGISSVGTFWGSSKKNVGANVVVATIQSLIAHGEKSFSPGYFDLIIHDEAHRSIYSPQARAAVERFFGAIKIGLTATPKDFLKNIDTNSLRLDDPRALESRIQRDTYRYFDCADGVATYRYTIQDGIRDRHLVPAKYYKMNTVLTQKSLSPEGLSFEGEEETFFIKDLEKKVFLPERNKLMMEEFLKYANKTPDGKIGKTIIFAVSRNHALELEKILNAKYPEFGGDFTKTIVSYGVNEPQQKAKDFKDPESKKTRVVTSVDMLTTGYDAPEVLNIVLCRPIFEPTTYQQIKGRGTRKCPQIDKKEFTIFDFCGVIEYFDEKYDWEAPLNVPKSKDEVETDFEPNESLGEISNSETEPNLKNKTFIDKLNNSPDLVFNRGIMTFGPDGDTVDKHMYATLWTDEVNKFVKEYPISIKLAESQDDDQIEKLLSLLNEKVLNKANHFFSEDNLAKSYGVFATIKDYFLNALNLIKLPNREEQLEEWRQGLLDKYGSKRDLPSQRRQLMIDLIAKELISNHELLQSIKSEPTLKFLNDQPFKSAYGPKEWLNEIGIEDLNSILVDVLQSKVLYL